VASDTLPAAELVVLKELAGSQAIDEQAAGAASSSTQHEQQIK